MLLYKYAPSGQMDEGGNGKPVLDGFLKLYFCKGWAK